jgi:hypothetical protein
MVLNALESKKHRKKYQPLLGQGPSAFNLYEPESESIKFHMLIILCAELPKPDSDQG